MLVGLIDQPPDTFWGHSGTFWTAIQALAGSIYTLLVIPTLAFIYLQVRAASNAFQFGAIQRLQELIDDFREDVHEVFTQCPAELAATAAQFPKRPPGRHHRAFNARLQPRIKGITSDQRTAMESLDTKTRERIIRVIERLNDIGQLVEEGFISQRMLLGKHHVMIIQCCHMVEVIRRDEEKRRGGNYGQRLLRMRNWAKNYNDIWPKHRAIPIKIVTGAHGEHCRVIYRSPQFSQAARIVLLLRGWLSRY